MALADLVRRLVDVRLLKYCLDLADIELPLPFDFDRGYFRVTRVGAHS